MIKEIESLFKLGYIFIDVYLILLKLMWIKWEVN